MAKKLVINLASFFGGIYFLEYILFQQFMRDIFLLLLILNKTSTSFNIERTDNKIIHL